MTDRTHPDSGRIITSGDILLHDAQTALMYEELRAAIDDGHESMTHADALAEIAAIRAENVELRAQLEAIGAGGVAPLIGQQTRDSFTAADMATAAEEGYRDGAAETAKLRGQRMVLCSLLGECCGHLEDAAHAMHMVEEEMPVWDLVERIESALKAISEDQVKGGES